MYQQQVTVTSSDGVDFIVTTNARSLEQMAAAVIAEANFAKMNTAAQLMRHSDFTLAASAPLPSAEPPVTPPHRRLTRADLRVIDGDRI